MAIVKRSALGTAVGGLGDIVLKIRNGRQYYCMKPAVVKLSYNPKPVLNRNRFSFISPLATALNKDYCIRSLWAKAEMKGESVRNKMMSLNFHKYSGGEDISKICIAPEGKHFTPEIVNSVWGNNRLEISVAPLNLGYNVLLVLEISVHGLLHFYDGDIELAPKPFLFFPFSSSAQRFIQNVPLSFELPFPEEAVENANTYKKMQALLMLQITTRTMEPDYGSVPFLLQHQVE